MKKYRLALSLLALSFLIAFYSCKKINEATELGSNLIPSVDNITTFQIDLDAITDNRLFDTTTAISFYDQVAVGHISTDPDFGNSHANAYFDISRLTFGSYPFIADKNSITVDSVVLSLSYTSSFGDTVSPLRITASEMTQSSGFIDTSFYHYESTPDFATNGPLGSKTFSMQSLRADSISVVRPGDTTKVANVVRIHLDNSLGQRFVNYDTAGAYKDEASFKAAFKGFAIKADNTGNGFAYFNLSDQAGTKLIIYYRALIDGKDSFSKTEFYHIPEVPAVIQHNPANYSVGQANSIVRSNNGNISAYLNGAVNDDRLFIQSQPGSYATIRIPALDTFKNKVIHRAEIIATVMNPNTSVFAPPAQLLIDRINKTSDTAFILYNDLPPSADGSIGFSVFGGNLLPDNTYHFNISRHVQAIITKHEPNDTLRLYAPLRANLWATNLKQHIIVPILPRAGQGRVVLGGGNNPDSKIRLRLRIIYSNL
ncbi:MAG: DUF4270 family protein [Flavisolibacter sp.]